MVLEWVLGRGCHRSSFRAAKVWKILPVRERSAPQVKLSKICETPRKVNDHLLNQTAGKELPDNTAASRLDGNTSLDQLEEEMIIEVQAFFNKYREKMEQLKNAQDIGTAPLRMEMQGEKDTG